MQKILYLFSLTSKESISLLKTYIYIHIYMQKCEGVIIIQSRIQRNKKRWLSLWSQINERDQRNLYLNFNENSFLRGETGGKVSKT